MCLRGRGRPTVISSTSPSRPPATSPEKDPLGLALPMASAELSRRVEKVASERVPGRQFGQGSAGCDEGGSSSSCSSISASRRRVWSSSWSRSGDGGLSSSRRASLRSCIARFSTGSIVFESPWLGRDPGGGSSGAAPQGVERVRFTKLVGPSRGDRRGVPAGGECRVHGGGTLWPQPVESTAPSITVARATPGVSVFR
jgi:hypothetical protein